MQTIRITACKKQVNDEGRAWKERRCLQGWVVGDSGSVVGLITPRSQLAIVHRSSKEPGWWFTLEANTHTPVGPCHTKSVPGQISEYPTDFCDHNYPCLPELFSGSSKPLSSWIKGGKQALYKKACNHWLSPTRNGLPQTGAASHP